MDIIGCNGFLYAKVIKKERLSLPSHTPLSDSPLRGALHTSQIQRRFTSVWMRVI